MQKTIDQHLDSLTKFATPIYATTHPYVPKIDHGTTSATLTFIRFKGEVWGVTCKHVAQERFEQLESRTGQWCIASGRLIQNFSYIASGEFRDSFLYPKDGSADVALCPLGHVWDFFEKEGCQAAVVLDTKELQDMLNASTQFETGLAIGFPDRAKELRIGKEGLRLIEKCTRLTGPLAPTDIPSSGSFGFSAPNNQSISQDLSGMSGGPVFGLPKIEGPFQEWQPFFLGITKMQPYRRETDPILPLEFCVVVETITQELMSSWLD